MEVINEWCAGLDVHKKTVVACVITPEGKGDPHLNTVTQGLLELADWLGGSQVTQVAMESTGSSGNPSTTCWRGWSSPWRLPEPVFSKQ